MHAWILGLSEMFCLQLCESAVDNLNSPSDVLVVPVTKDRIESANFSIEFLDQFRKFHGFFVFNGKFSGILDEFGHF